jgi:hypothetical protein
MEMDLVGVIMVISMEPGILAVAMQRLLFQRVAYHRKMDTQLRILAQELIKCKLLFTMSFLKDII